MSNSPKNQLTKIAILALMVYGLPSRRSKSFKRIRYQRLRNQAIQTVVYFITISGMLALACVAGAGTVQGMFWWIVLSAMATAIILNVFDYLLN